MWNLMLVRFALLGSWPIFFSFWRTSRFLSLFWNFGKYLSLNLAFIYPAWYMVGSFNLKICVFPSEEKFSVMSLIPTPCLFLFSFSSLFFFFIFFFFWEGAVLSSSNSYWMNGCDLPEFLSVYGLFFHFSLLCVFFLCCRFHWLPDNWSGFQPWLYYSFCLLDF